MILFITNIKNAFVSLLIAKVFKWLLLSILINALLLGALNFLAFALFGGLFDPTGIVGWIISALLGIAQVAVSLFLFPILLPIIISFFAEPIASAIEEKEYPKVPVPVPPFWPTMYQEVKFVIKVIGLNILALPFYLIPGINLITYYLLNGYLLGTEFFNIVAGRHIELKEARLISKNQRWQIILCGIGITIAATIPILNLIAPIFGVALMVHFFHGLNPKYKVLVE